MFPSHREVVVTVNDKDSSFTGTSGTIAWQLEEENVHLIVMWSLPYNLNIYNSYYGLGVVQLSTRYYSHGEVKLGVLRCPGSPVTCYPTGTGR